MQFKGKNRPPTPDIAAKLNVDAVVEGSVSRSGDKVRITAQLIDARADKHLWANTFERSSHDVLALQAELASAIAREVNVQLTASERSRLTATPSVSPDAHDAYLKGRYFFNRPSDDNLQKAIAQFEEAVRLSPTFAPAFSGLSDAYLWAGYNEGFLTATEARPKAKAAAEKAVAVGRQLRRSAHVPGRVQAVLRIRPGWVRARIPACVCAQPQLRVRARSVRYGAGLPGTVQGSDRRGRARDRTGSAVSTGAHRCDHCVSCSNGIRRRPRDSDERAAELDPTYFFPVMIDGWTDLQVGKFREAHPGIEEGQGDGVATIRDRVSRVRLWRRR